MSSISLPLTVEDITAAWLTEALQARHPKVAVESLDVVDVQRGTADKVRIAVTYNAAGRAAGLPSRLIVKGGFAERHRPLAWIFVPEIAFYRDLNTQYGVNAAACYAALSDHEAQQHIVVLEDLALRNVTFCRVANPLNQAQAAQFLDIMARYHACTWDKARALAKEEAYASLVFWDALPHDPARGYGMSRLEPDVWSELMGLPRAIGVPQMFKDRMRMRRALECLNEFGRTGPQCFLHADFHLGNLYFDSDGKAGVLDWQSASFGHWSHDVTYFIVSALDPVDRRRWDKALVAYYLRRLEAYGVTTPPSLDEALTAFRVQIVDGLYYWMVNPVEMQSELNNCCIVPRFVVAALDYDTFGLVP